MAGRTDSEFVDMIHCHCFLHGKADFSLQYRAVPGLLTRYKVLYVIFWIFHYYTVQEIQDDF